MDFYMGGTTDSSGECQQVGPVQKGGYQPRSTYMMAPNQAQSVPVRVALAMRFIEMCNSYTHPKGFLSGDSDDGSVKATVINTELPPTQDAAMRFACKCLGDYFHGKEITDEQWKS